jgi:1-deoxy-D-xylulose-5-phosphate synthase
LLLNACYQHPGPASVRYPRGAGTGVPAGDSLEPVPIGRAVVRRRGSGVALLVFGTLLSQAAPVADALGATLVDMRFAKPLDETLLEELARSHELFVTIEEAAVMGGAGSAVTEYLNREAIVLPVLQLGLPDEFIDHGDQKVILAGLGLDAAGIEASIRQRLNRTIS